MNIWFTSDTHFSHKNIIQYCNRPFASSEEMDEIMISRWNSLVKPNDVIYHLGDFSLWHKSLEMHLPRLQGQKHLIAGNHDMCHPAHRRYKPYRVGEYLKAGFVTVQLQHTLEIADRKFDLCHLPDIGDHGKERFIEFRPKDNGNVILHGHVHDRWKQKDNKINVGVDVWDFYPVHMDSVLELVNA